SKAENPGNFGEPGNSDSCQGGLSTSFATLTTKCGVATYTQWFYCDESGGGNCLSDNSIAEESGDIYFFSQEQLDGTRGIDGQENLYVYRKGSVHHVVTLTGPPRCATQPRFFCQRLLRIQISPDGSHMSFVTASAITLYDNAGHTEFSRYRPASRDLVCVSCLPSGDPPTSDVEVSI